MLEVCGKTGEMKRNSSFCLLHARHSIRIDIRVKDAGQVRSRLVRVNSLSLGKEGLNENREQL